MVHEEVTSFLTKGVGFGGKKTLRPFRCLDTANEQKAAQGFRETVETPYHDGIRNCPSLTRSFMDELGFGVLTKLQESEVSTCVQHRDVFIPDENLHGPVSSLGEAPSAAAGPVNLAHPACAELLLRGNSRPAGGTALEGVWWTWTEDCRHEMVHSASCTTS